MLVLALVVAACSGGGDDRSPDGEARPVGNPGDGPTDVVPAAGGDVRFAVEAETPGGFCLPEAQLAVSGLQIARSIYDTLAAPTVDGTMAPHLASSIDPTEDFTRWRVTLREGITFHDGSELDATVVKNNLDAYRGVYPGRTPLLFRFVFQNVRAVEVVDPLTVEVVLDVPVVAFDQALFAGGRVGIMAQAQLDSTDCASELIGTGPFELATRVIGEETEVVRNSRYWRSDERGQQLPYLDSLTFVPVPDAQQRITALETGAVQLIHSSDASLIGNRLRPLAESGDIDLIESDAFAEVQFIMLNLDQPPFDNRNARLAFAAAIDRELLIEVVYDGLLAPAGGPFSEGSSGHLDEPGGQPHDVDAARRFADAYEQETGEPLNVALSTVANDVNTLLAQEIEGQLAAAGIASSTVPSGDQATLINLALSGEFEAMPFRQFVGGDPDRHYINLRSGSPVNLMRLDDPVIDELLDRGRAEPDDAERDEIYEKITRRMAEEGYGYFVANTRWAVAGAPGVGGVLGTPSADGQPPFPGLSEGFPTAGLFVNSAEEDIGE